MACPVHGGSLATPCHCPPTVNDRRVQDLIAALQAAPAYPNPPLRPGDDYDALRGRWTFPRAPLAW